MNASTQRTLETLRRIETNLDGLMLRIWGEPPHPPSWQEQENAEEIDSRPIIDPHQEA